MANTASAAKQARGALRRRAVNRLLLDHARLAQKKVVALITAGKRMRRPSSFQNFSAVSIAPQKARQSIITGLLALNLGSLTSSDSLNQHRS